MDGDVADVLAQRVAQGLGEHADADLLHRVVAVGVALGLDDDQLGRVAHADQRVADVPGLRGGQLRAAGADADDPGLPLAVLAVRRVGDGVVGVSHDFLRFRVG